MTEQSDKRAERLKAALRENLRRRKAQVRGRSEAPAEPPRREGDTDDPPQRASDDPT